MLKDENILKNNKKIIAEIALDKNLSKNTITSYQSIMKQYCKFHDMYLRDLLDEAYDEEEQGVILKRRKIKERIITYRRYLQKQNNQPQTINTKIAKIKALYKFYDIELPYIPNMIKKQHETINDIPSKEDIKYVLENTGNLRFKALILFLISSGNSLNEALNIKVNDFINATGRYHDYDDINNCIKKLDNKKNIIPTFYMYRKKTNYPYITFCSPEATQAIINYLKNRIQKEYHIDGEDKLFNIKKITVQSHFRRINDKLDLGYSGQYRYFHAHALRKYFATQLLKAEMDSMTIDFLSGRTISKTRQAYFKADPEKLREKYIQTVNLLTINDEYKIQNREEKQYISIASNSYYT